MSKAKSKIRQCAYCGVVAEMTKEHVIPRGLFTSPRPANLITIPVCKNCNHLKSKDDDFLRDFLTLDQYSYQSEIAKSIFRGKVTRSVIRKSSDIGKIVLSKGSIVPAYSQRRVYLGRRFSFPIDGDRLASVLFTIARGLSYHIHKSILLPDFNYRVLRYKPWEFSAVWRKFEVVFGSIELPALGKVFRASYIPSLDSFTNVWLLQFYESIGFSVVVASSEENLREIVNNLESNT